MNKLTKTITVVMIFLAGSLFVSCEKSVDRDFNSAMIEAQKSNWRTALSRFEGVMKVDPSSEAGLKSAREAVRISFYEVKDYKRTLQYLRHLVLYSPNSEESVASQRQIINISFDQLQEYEQAIEEISRLLQIEKNPDVRIELKLKLARSYFHLNNFFQSSAEVADMLKKPEAAKYEFELKLLKANILTASKSYQEAVVLLKEIMDKWPEQALRENVPMTLTVCFEEMKDFKSAIDVLESIKPTHPVPEFVELRLKRLKDRKMNQPGARGWRK